MAEFKIPDLNVTFTSSVDTLSTSNELPFIPFSDNQDELDFASFN